MDPKTAQILLGAAGSGGAGEALYVDDVFSTFLYEGDHTTSGRAINNGIDLAGEGGCVWLKHRTGTGNGIMVQDTERFVSTNDANNIDTSSSSAESHFAGFHSFNSNGFSVKHNPGNLFNAEDNDYVSWSFRKAPGFFDVVTYTGTGSARTIAHNLGSTPGMILIKGTSQAYDWKVWHRSLGSSKYIVLNSNAAEVTGDTAHWNNTDPTSTHFSLGTGVGVNANGESFVAYVFAHADTSFGTNSDEEIIRCGSYTGSTTTKPFVTTGFEPQWLLIKRATNSDPWVLIDNMRGIPTDQAFSRLEPNTNGAEDDFGQINLEADGFQINQNTGFINANSNTYIYVAIRRPHKPADAATDVFNVQVLPSNSASNSTFISTGFDVDVCLDLEEAGDVYVKTNFMFRLLGNGKELDTQTTSATSETTWEFDHSDGFKQGSTNGTHAIASFRRAPGFLDVVCFEGDGSFGTRSHNLGVTPELVVQKSREFADEWNVISSGKIQYFNRTQAASNSSISNKHSSTVFGINTDNSSDSYICLLFASLSGVSKVGTYSGTGNNIDVDCGFTAGARFVIIKRQDSTGDWYTFNTAHGIVSGNDPYKFLNEDGAATNTDYIDPLNAGFTITSSAPAELNTSGGTYLFLAIA